MTLVLLPTAGTLFVVTMPVAKTEPAVIAPVAASVVAVTVPKALVPDQVLAAAFAPKFVLTQELGGTAVDESPTGNT